MLENIKNLIFETSNADKNMTITENTVIQRDLNLNSLELVSLVCAAEDEFDVEIADKDIKRLVTIGDLIDYIEAQK